MRSVLWCCCVPELYWFWDSFFFFHDVSQCDLLGLSVWKRIPEYVYICYCVLPASCPSGSSVVVYGHTERLQTGEQMNQGPYWSPRLLIYRITFWKGSVEIHVLSVLNLRQLRWLSWLWFFASQKPYVMSLYVGEYSLSSSVRRFFLSLPSALSLRLLPCLFLLKVILNT